MKTNLLKMTDSSAIKAVLIAVLVLLMLIPISMVKSLINERETVKNSVKKDISLKWGGSQNLTGPILVLPYKDSNNSANVQYAYFLPDVLNIDGDIKVEDQQVGMFNVPCYQSDIKCDGRFTFPDYEKLNLRIEQIKWDDAYLLLEIPSLQGIKNNLNFEWNGKYQTAVSANQNNPVIQTGLSVKAPITIDTPKEYFDFQFDLVLNGTDSINFTPLGKQTHIRLKSDWKQAEFIGDFMPTKETHNSNGVEASWDIFDYNRSYPQMWTGVNNSFKGSDIGVNLQNPIDQYRKTMRSVKYAVMFIALTFLVFFIVELLSRKRIHPIQYFLVSFALVLFYCLLLALSEHLRFGFAFLISAIAIIALITAYAKSVFKNIKQTVIMGLFLTGLYVFLYVILQLEEMSLLLGSIGLFIALATVMYVSRKIDWYKKSDNYEDTEVMNEEIEN
ncbi:cell envelope integrity protein CreD [Dysgonomonas sp. 216]|uniref:cell envelope integrity protein CreD n=1 Tax=Dysgonomonas sp. 216 TaxID=2302934 RepID=UPI0013CF40C4|nr:cell envelope integrity protein CreD [Dysgonomonas sp. 216]NDW17576.1 cell envelope integrity protein CreD [Dysgonomonas sp. 216]